MARERVQTRCDPDTIDGIEQYADEQNLSQSEAVRRLIRTSLHRKGYEIEDYEEVERAAMRHVLIMTAMVGVLALLVGLFAGMMVF
jgi:hypothetical protein